MRWLLSIQRTNKFVYDTVNNSVLLQRRIWFLPPEGKRMRSTINPLLQTVSIFSHGARYGSWPGNSVKLGPIELTQLGLERGRTQSWKMMVVAVDVDRFELDLVFGQGVTSKCVDIKVKKGKVLTAGELITAIEGKIASGGEKISESPDGDGDNDDQ